MYVFVIAVWLASLSRQLSETKMIRAHVEVENAMLRDLHGSVLRNLSQDASSVEAPVLKTVLLGNLERAQVMSPLVL